VNRSSEIVEFSAIAVQEKWLGSKAVREQLSSVHSGWTNWYLQTGQYGKAREAVWRAAQLDPRSNIAVKWLLTWISPQLALRTVQRYQERSKESSRFM